MRDIRKFSDDELINIVSEYADYNPQFDNSYAENLERWLEEHDDLTDNQRQGLINIIENFHMDY
jgi:hypothetical protein